MISIKNHLFIEKVFQYVYKTPDCYVFVQKIKGGQIKCEILQYLGWLSLSLIIVSPEPHKYLL